MIKKIKVKDNIRRSYSIFEIFELGWCMLLSKLLDRRIRIIRRPFILRGRKYIDFGNGLTTGYWCRFEVFPLNDKSHIRLKFGNNIQINDFVHICAMEKVEIGDGCLFASHVYISDNSHGIYKGQGAIIHSSPNIPPDHREYVTKPVKIGNNCWLGEGVIVMPGVMIGDGCVIGAHSVVNNDIPPACIAVGCPAKVVKRYSYDKKEWIKVN